MLTSAWETWTKVVVSSILMLTVNAAIFPGTLRRKYAPELLSYYNARSEAGFNLNQEDITKFHIWPTGNIPYYIDDFSFDKVLRDRIRMFLDGVDRLTALRFVEIPKPPEDDETRWVLFLNRKGLLGCADHPFKHFTNEGLQKVVLGYDCMNSDENLAEVVLSLVGVPPQHNAPDRDKYVVIMNQNILPDKLHLFNKLKDTEWMFHNLTYDFESAGHYGPFKHTSNGKVTVQGKPRDYYLFHNLDSPAPKPTEKGFSSQDILKIAMLYNYIVRNRETPGHECSKLFAPGSKPFLLQQNKNLEIKPRKKPSRYLGESEKEQVFDEEENGNGEMNNDNKMMTDDNEGKDIEELDNGSETNETNYSYSNDSEENKKELNLCDKMNDGNKNEYSNEDDNNEERDYSISINEENKKKLNTNKNLINNNEDDDKEEIESNVSKSKRNEKKLNNHFNDSNENENQEKDNNTSNERKSTEISDKEGRKSNENSEITENIDGLVNTTRMYEHKPLMLKIVNPKKLKLLGQSDYETGDEGKNKYIHEKFF